jgi:hypothetical protein
MSGEAVKRLNIFAKGNLDLRDTLHSQKLADRLAWNGINEILRASYGCTARVRHETITRSDALLEADGTIPDTLRGRALPLGPYPLESQFGTQLFDANADAYVLSIQPEVNIGLLRHRAEKFLFYPHNWPTWPAADQAWLKECFISTGFLEPAQSMANLRQVIERIQARSAAPILIYNVSAVVPGEHVHIHSGMEDLLSTRTRRFNLALIELSQETGVSIIDVDTILAREGCARLTYDTVHLNADGCRAVAKEVVRVLDDLGCLPADGAR